MMSVFCPTGTAGSKNLVHAVVILALACAGLSLEPPLPHAAATKPRQTTAIMNARSARISHPPCSQHACWFRWYRREVVRVRSNERLVLGDEKTFLRAHRPPSPV